MNTPATVFAPVRQGSGRFDQSQGSDGEPALPGPPLRVLQPAPTDPRIGQLENLVQGLLTEIGDVATAMAVHIPSAVVRDQLLRDVEKRVGTARGRATAIALGE
jgi:hypothetical protein